MPSSESAIRAWVNARKTLTGPGRPLRGGAVLAGQAYRSPADGAYARLSRTTAGATRGIVAEDSNPSVCRITALVFAGTVEASEAAATALSDAWRSLTGLPEPCGDTGVTVLVADNHMDPAYVQQPAGSGEQHCFMVSAEFVLRT